MKTLFHGRHLQAALVIGAWLGSMPLAGAQLMQGNPSESANRFRLGYQMGFNVSMSLQNLAPAPAFPGNPSVTGLSYEDGFVGTDISGNAGGKTWNWGYANSSQVVGGNILMHTSAAGSLGKSFEDDPQHGLELTYGRRLGEWNRFRWGAEIAFGISQLDLDHQAVAPSSVLQEDAFGLGGVVPPAAPYSGTFVGPGPLISAVPTSLPVSVVSRLRSELYGWRLGPYLELPLSDRISVSLNGGLAVALLNADFSYRETVSVPAVGVVTRSAQSGSASDVLVGGYVGLQLDVAVAKSVSAFAGIRYQNLGSTTFSAGDKQARLKLDKSFFVTVGLGWSF